MQALAALGWMALALLVLLILAVVLPAYVLVEQRNGEWTLRARVLFVTVRLYPRKKREKKKQEPEETEKQDTGQNEPSRTKSGKRRRALLHKIVESARTVGGFMRRVLRFVRVRDIEWTLPVHEEDAALTAIRYGRIQAAVGTTVAALRNIVRLEFKHVNIFADFDGVCENQESFSCKIGAPPVIIAVAAVWAYLRLTEAKVL